MCAMVKTAVFKCFDFFLYFFFSGLLVTFFFVAHVFSCNLLCYGFLSHNYTVTVTVLVLS